MKNCENHYKTSYNAFFNILESLQFNIYERVKDDSIKKKTPLIN